MKIQLTCTHCNSELRVGIEHAGKHVRCPVCQQLTLIPYEQKPTDDQIEIVHDSSSEPKTSSPEPPWPAYSTGQTRANYQSPNNDVASLVLGGLAIVSVFICGCFGMIVTPCLAFPGLSLANSSRGPNRQAAKTTNIIALIMWAMACLFWIAVVFVG